MINDSGLIIVGAKGHAKVVLSVALSNSEKVAGFLDDDSMLANQSINGYPMLGNTSVMELQQGPIILGIGSNSVRKKLAERPLNWKTLIHPTAYVHSSVKIGKGTVVFAGAIIQPDVIIGEHCIINTGATIDHDCVIKDYAHLAPGVHLAGGITVGEGTLLGIGSVVIPNIQIGDWVQIGAGSVVVKSISEKRIVMGVPAKEKI